MSTVKYNTPTAASTIMTTELYSIANNANSSLSPAIDNDTALNLFATFELNIDYTGSAPTAGSPITLYILPSIDGTNYADGSAGVSGDIPQNALIAGVFEVRATTNAMRLVITGVQLPPNKFKVMLRNETGQTWPASATTLNYSPYNLQTYA